MRGPLPCLLCGELPEVGDFPLIDLRHRGWTCLCPNRCYETATYYERKDAVADWNLWVESEGAVFHGEDTLEYEDEVGWEGW